MKSNVSYCILNIERRVSFLLNSLTVFNGEDAWTGIYNK